MVYFFAAWPLWAILVSTMAGLALCSELGYRLGRAASRPPDGAAATDLGATLGGLLGLLGLLLGFTFSMAGDRFDTRKNLVVEEANAIGTAWLRTDLVPEPQRGDARRALRAYVDARLDAAVVGHRDAAIARSEQLQVQMWAAARDAAAAAPTPTVALFVSAVNEVIDMHGRRLAQALRNPIPPTILGTLYLVAFLVMAAMGYARGLTGDRSLVATFVLLVVLAVVLTVIIDFDRPYEGLLTVSQQAMRDVKASMGAEP
jgi:hypothetical protein